MFPLGTVSCSRSEDCGWRLGSLQGPQFRKLGPNGVGLNHRSLLGGRISRPVSPVTFRSRGCIVCARGKQTGNSNESLKPTKSALTRLRKDRLVEELTVRHADTTGNKAALVERLLALLESEKSGEEVEPPKKKAPKPSKKTKARDPQMSDAALAGLKHSTLLRNNKAWLENECEARGLPFGTKKQMVDALIANATKKIGGAAPEKAAPSASPQKEFDAEDLMKLKVTELKDLCRNTGLAVRGNKAALVERLMQTPRSVAAKKMDETKMKAEKRTVPESSTAGTAETAESEAPKTFKRKGSGAKQKARKAAKDDLDSVTEEDLFMTPDEERFVEIVDDTTREVLQGYNEEQLTVLFEKTGLSLTGTKEDMLLVISEKYDEIVDRLDQFNELNERKVRKWSQSQGVRYEDVPTDREWVEEIATEVDEMPSGAFLLGDMDESVNSIVTEMFQKYGQHLPMDKRPPVFTDDPELGSLIEKMVEADGEREDSLEFQLDQLSKAMGQESGRRTAFSEMELAEPTDEDLDEILRLQEENKSIFDFDDPEGDFEDEPTQKIQSDMDRPRDGGEQTQNSEVSTLGVEEQTIDQIVSDDILKMDAELPVEGRSEMADEGFDIMDGSTAERSDLIEEEIQEDPKSDKTEAVDDMVEIVTGQRGRRHRRKPRAAAEIGPIDKSVLNPDYPEVHPDDLKKQKLQEANKERLNVAGRVYGANGEGIFGSDEGEETAVLEQEATAGEESTVDPVDLVDDSDRSEPEIDIVSGELVGEMRVVGEVQEESTVEDEVVDPVDLVDDSMIQEDAVSDLNGKSEQSMEAATVTDTVAFDQESSVSRIETEFGNIEILEAEYIESDDESISGTSGTGDVVESVVDSGTSYSAEQALDDQLDVSTLDQDSDQSDQGVGEVSVMEAKDLSESDSELDVPVVAVSEAAVDDRSKTLEDVEEVERKVEEEKQKVATLRGQVDAKKAAIMEVSNKFSETKASQTYTLEQMNHLLQVADDLKSKKANFQQEMQDRLATLRQAADRVEENKKVKAKLEAGLLEYQTQLDELEQKIAEKDDEADKLKDMINRAIQEYGLMESYPAIGNGNGEAGPISFPATSSSFNGNSWGGSENGNGVGLGFDIDLEMLRPLSYDLAVPPTVPPVVPPDVPHADVGGVDAIDSDEEESPKAAIEKSKEDKPQKVGSDKRTKEVNPVVAVAAGIMGIAGVVGSLFGGKQTRKDPKEGDVSS